MVFVQQMRFAIEKVEVRVRGHKQCLEFCVYRLETVQFPMRHGTNNLFKFEYIVVVTRERPTDDTQY